MKLKHIVIAAAAAVTLPAFAGDARTAGNYRSFGEAGPEFFMDPPSMRTRAEVRAELRGFKSFGEAGVPFDFNTMSMLTREQVRSQLMAHLPAEYAGA